MRLLSMGLLVLLVSTTGLLGGCGAAATGSSVGSPRSQIEAWNAAVDRDDPKAAYALLSESMRKQIAYEEFAEKWRETPAERKRQATALGGSLRENPGLGEKAVISFKD